MESNVLNAKPRNTSGKGSSRQLRMQGRIPAIFYFKGIPSISLSLDYREFHSLVKTNPSLIDLVVEGQDPRECIIREMQKDPVTERAIHVDLLGIKRGQKLKVTVPLRLTGTPTGVKTSGGILQQVTTELDIECLPKDIPQRITVDVSDLEIGNTVFVGDLDYPDLKFLTETRVVIASVIEPVISKETTDEVPADEEVEGEESESESEE